VAERQVPGDRRGTGVIRPLEWLGVRGARVRAALARVEPPHAADRPLVRFVGRSAVVIHSRRRIVLTALARRSRAPGRSFTVWPDLAAPVQIVPVERPDLASWATATFEPWRRRPGWTAFLWGVLRARALLTVTEPGPLVPFAESVLGRSPGSMDAVFVSTTGGRASKLLCFVFDAGVPSPAAVAKVVPDRRYADGLLREARVLAELRSPSELPDDVAAALPPAPIATELLDRDFVVVEPADELAAATGSEDRAAALGWLERFHEATASEIRPWDEDDTARLVAHVRYAWERERPEQLAAVLEELARLSAELHGTPVARCASHGDFWRGNIALRDGSLRVFDWEWAELDSTPFLDLWSHELTPLLDRVWERDAELLDALAHASSSVEAGLAARGLPPRFARATLAPMLAELAFRFRRERGIAGGSETRFARMLPAVEQRLGLRRAD
jgi:hypothetical protein